MPENPDKKDMNKPGQRPVQQPDKTKQGGMGQDKDKTGQPGQRQDQDTDLDDKTTQRNPRQGTEPNPR